MSDFPLLIFPKPETAAKAKKFGGGDKFREPDPGRQAKRLAPQFQRLQQALDRQKIALQQSSLGILPEQVLVLETIGPIGRFFNAVGKLDGFEWLGEFDIDEISPAYGFEDETDPDKPLKGFLFLVMSDQSALEEMRKLFRNWQANPQAPFPRGLTPLRDAFAHLHTIRPWGAGDRIRETGVIEDWRERIEHGQENVPFELELWYRSDEARRRQAESYVESTLHTVGGQIVQRCQLPGIHYHGILARAPIDAIARVVSDLRQLESFRVLQCEDIMYVRPVGQCRIGIPDEPLIDIASMPRVEAAAPDGEPIIALFDGLPLQQHVLLKGRLIVDDPDDYESAYQAEQRQHGTAMASLICHGDLNDNAEPLDRPIYVRPILQPAPGFGGQTYEKIPEDVLPVDAVHRAVRRLYEEQGGEPPAAPHVRVINLSVCDAARPLDRGMSAWARLLDWLSWEYDILFIVSAGNHTRDLELNVPRPDFRALTAEERQQAVIEALATDTRHRRLLAPAEALNGITVGAAHIDSGPGAVNPNLIDPHEEAGLPSTVCAHGPGYRRGIKPDIFLPGGRQYLTEKLGNSHSNATLCAHSFISAPGQRVATPAVQGHLDRSCYIRGTSNAAALASRNAAIILENLATLRVEERWDLPEEYETVLLKALLVHDATWGAAGPIYESVLKNDGNSRVFTDYVARFLGYGISGTTRVMACTAQRVTVIGFGEVGDDEGQVFRFPLPPSLSAVTEKRRLSITLAWNTPVSPSRQGYRVAQLWFSPKNSLAPTRINADWQATQRGTVQHEILEGEKAVDFQDGESLDIKVSCRADAEAFHQRVRYGLAVTLEVAEGVKIPIYEEVRDRLRVQVQS